MSRSDIAPPPPRAAPEDSAADDQPLRDQLRTIIVAWIFGAFWLSTISGAALARFEIALGTPDWAFGILAALPFAAGLVQLPVSMLQARIGRRKEIFLATVIVGRLMWVVTAAIPWLIPESRRELWWPLMIVCLGVAWAANSAGTPPWMDWMADVIPARLRGRFFARRNRVGQLVSLAASLAIGYVLNVADRAGSEEVMRTATAGVLALAGLMGALDVLAFRRLPDRPRHDPAPRQGMLQMLGEPLRSRSFRWYLAFNFMFNVAIGFIGQYIWLYVFREIQLSNLQANLLLIAVPYLVFASVYGPWGRLIDRLGRKPVLLIAGLVMVNGAWGWILVGQGSWVLNTIGYTVAVVAMCCWPGVEIANFNMLLGMTGTREGKRTGGAYVALYGIAVALGGILSGLMGSTVSAALETWRWAVPLLGVTLTYHGVLFLISTALRVVALSFAMRIEEPRAMATRAALRHMTTNLYSNVRDAALLPTRVAERAYRFTYRLRPRGSAGPAASPRRGELRE